MCILQFICKTSIINNIALASVEAKNNDILSEYDLSFNLPPGLGCFLFYLNLKLAYFLSKAYHIFI